MGKIWNAMSATMVGVALVAGTACAQVPLKNISIPVPPIHGGPPVMINVNPQGLPVGTQAPVQQPFTMFGLLPPVVSGLCAQVTATYVSVTDGVNFKVITLPPGFIAPQGLTAGRQIKVTYRLLNNGLLQATHVAVLSGPQPAFSGTDIPRALIQNIAIPAINALNLKVPNINVPGVQMPTN